jgi:hypothetical protein
LAGDALLEDGAAYVDFSVHDLVADQRHLACWSPTVSSMTGLPVIDL